MKYVSGAKRLRDFKPARAVIGLTAVAALLSFAATAAVAQQEQDPLVIDLAAGSVAEADGTSLSVTWVQKDPGLTIGETTLSNGDGAKITKLSAPRPSADILRPPRSEVDVNKLARAKLDPGILTADLVGTPFVEGNQDSISSGLTASTPADPGLFEVTAISAVTTSTVSYAWNAEGARFEISRNGSPFLATKNPSFTDSGLAPGSTVNYGVTAYDADGAVLATRFLPITTEGDGKLVAPMNYQNYVSQAIYRTFIPDARVSLDFFATMGCGQAGQANRTFGGDDRGFAAPNQYSPWDGFSSRTSVALNINWDSPYPYDVLWVKQVGTTHLYDGSILIDERTASDAGIQISEVMSTGSYAQARVNHDVANPFCAAGSIKYNVIFRWYRNGTIEVVGWRQPVPNHEIWGGWDNGVGNMDWYTFGLYNNEGFGCLVGACGNRDVNASQTH